MDDTSTIRPLALVTGASSGIGLELARTFAENGFDLLVCAEDAGIAVAAEGLVGETGAAVRSVRADLSTHDGVEQLVREATATGRALDALALNAGIANGGPFLETPLDDELRVIGLNVASVVHLAKRLLPAMVARGSGRVLVTSSVASLMAGPYYATYAASKAFVQSFSEAIRHELKDTGVTVTMLLPGPTDTEFFEASHMEDTRAAQGPKDDPAKVAREGFEGLMAGKEKVTVTSLKTRAQTVLSHVLPEKAQPGAHATMTKPQDTDA